MMEPLSAIASWLLRGAREEPVPATLVLTLRAQTRFQKQLVHQAIAQVRGEASFFDIAGERFIVTSMSLTDDHNVEIGLTEYEPS